MHDIHVCGIMYRVTGDRNELDGPSNLPVYSNKFPARVSVLLQDARTGNPVHEYLDKAEITMKLHMRRNGEEESRHIKTGIPFAKRHGRLPRVLPSNLTNKYKQCNDSTWPSAGQRPELPKAACCSPAKVS